MLLEELLGISNKRLKAIFDGKTLNEDSSSTDEDQDPIDVISLDDITDDDFILIDSGKFFIYLLIIYISMLNFQIMKQINFQVQ